MTNKKTRRPRVASPTQRLITFTQASVEYGPPYRSLYDLYLRGVLPAVCFPGSRRLWLDRADVEALIAKSRELRS